MSFNVCLLLISKFDFLLNKLVEKNKNAENNPTGILETILNY